MNPSIFHLLSDVHPTISIFRDKIKSYSHFKQPMFFNYYFEGNKSCAPLEFPYTHIYGVFCFGFDCLFGGRLSFGVFVWVFALVGYFLISFQWHSEVKRNSTPDILETQVILVIQLAEHSKKYSC